MRNVINLKNVSIDMDEVVGYDTTPTRSCGVYQRTHYLFYVYLKSGARIKIIHNDKDSVLADISNLNMAR